MFIKSATSVLSLLFLINTISAQCLTGHDDTLSMSANTRKGLIKSRFEFAMETLKKTALIESRDNIFYSPHSLHEAITLAYFGARGTTESSLQKALHLPGDLSKVDVQRYYSYENSLEAEIQRNASTGYEFNSANRLWIANTRRVRECMLNLFGNQLVETDFRSNPEAARNNINQWVSNMTKGHINDLLPDGSIDEQTDLVLANAVYFKGIWHSRFDQANSKKDLFYTSGSQHSMVTFMKQKGNFNHMISEVLGAHVLELPYKGEEISMFVLLPPFATARSSDASDQPGERDGIRQLIERISTESGSAELRDLLDSGIPLQQVEVILPRFEIEKELPLNTLLQEIGAGELLAPNSADLRGFLEDGEPPVALGDAVHRAKIEVTEEGTTAAAATALYTFRSGRPLQPAVFDANHPFLFFIYNKPMRTILFAGVYRTPNSPQNTAETAAA
ncbi:serine protease inhibitor 88Ea-like isoform X2 [Ceratina calcarata]|uniref:Serine protease inhibitor 88Ea-like isoform X2 n=1 Tax=Ceratina calcarata TaxID=156304 RepID=A0AAJ7ITR9_9HYME|nr:serine protease inhibitor 88Ea-like isoform X2 [Ceratina calcarata]